MMCPCGREIEYTTATYYSFATYNDKGEIIFAICHHGTIVIDDKEKNEKVYNQKEAIWLS